MKTTTSILLGCLITFALAAAEPLKPAVFEVCLVVDSLVPGTSVVRFTPPDKKVVETLVIKNKPLLGGSVIMSAAVQKSTTSGAPEIAITFTAQGAELFAEVTRAHVGHRLAMMIDGRVYAAPRLMAEIPGGKAVISGSFTDEEAILLAERLNTSAPH